MPAPDAVQHPAFAPWRPWAQTVSDTGLTMPGIYAIAVSGADLDGTEYTLRSEIQYFGMTLSRGGLISRLRQFHGALFGQDGPHGGAWRFRFDYPNAIWVMDHFFVSVACYDCDPNRHTPENLRTMGRVLEREYLCFADYKERFGQLPRYNDTALRPRKYSGEGPNVGIPAEGCLSRTSPAIR